MEDAAIGIVSEEIAFGFTESEPRQTLISTPRGKARGARWDYPIAAWPEHRRRLRPHWCPRSPRSGFRNEVPMSLSGGSEGLAKPAKGRSPGRNRALIYGFGVAFPLVVAGLIFFAEPPIDLGDLVNWAAAAVWIALAVAVSMAITRSQTPWQQRAPVILLVVFMLAVVQVGTGSSSLAPAAAVLGEGFWAFFVGLAVYSIGMFGFYLRLRYCRTCNRYLWMAPVGGGRECPKCQTVWSGLG